MSGEKDTRAVRYEFAADCLRNKQPRNYEQMARPGFLFAFFVSSSFSSSSLRDISEMDCLGGCWRFLRNADGDSGD